MIGLSFGIMGFGYAVAQALLVRPVTERFGNLGAARAALLTGAFGFLSLVWIVDGHLALLLLPVFAIHSIARTGITAHMSLGASEDVQGKLQGMLASLSRWRRSSPSRSCRRPSRAVRLTRGQRARWRGCRS